VGFCLSSTSASNPGVRYGHRSPGYKTPSWRLCLMRLGLTHCRLLPFFILCFKQGVIYRHPVTWMSKGGFTCPVQFQSCPIVFLSLLKTHCTRSLPDTLLNAAPSKSVRFSWTLLRVLSPDSGYYCRCWYLSYLSCLLAGILVRRR
jgi:hypothetical protein